MLRIRTRRREERREKRVEKNLLHASGSARVQHCQLKLNVLACFAATDRFLCPFVPCRCNSDGVHGYFDAESRNNAHISSCKEEEFGCPEDWQLRRGLVLIQCRGFQDDVSSGVVKGTISRSPFDKLLGSIQLKGRMNFFSDLQAAIHVCSLVALDLTAAPPRSPPSEEVLPS